MSLSNTNFSNKEIDLFLSKAEKVFFIGIGGISMSAIATFTASLGKEVYGYDRTRSCVSSRLEKIGKIKYSSTPDNVKGMDLVVYSCAIDEKNHEYRQSRRQGTPLISRANFLGYIISLHKRGIGVCGMHGKTTTTAMISHIFYNAEENPTIFCGGEMINFDSNYRLGGRGCCVFEACEYQNSFLSLPTTDAVVLNIDYDHPDFFESLDQIKSSFKEYIKDAKRVYLNCDDENVKELCHKNAITFGFDSHAIYRGEIYSVNSQGTSFKVYKHQELLCVCHISFFGKHTVLNSLCAFAVAHTNGISVECIKESLSTFKGVKRRTEFLRKSDTGADIFEDYGHHPTEIISSISAFLEMGYKRILCVFQPHTFSRTHFLYSQFTSAFESVTELIIAPTFSAREQNIFELSEEAFALDCGGVFISDFEKIAHRVKGPNCDCVILMGAGDLKSKLKM